MNGVLGTKSVEQRSKSETNVLSNGLTQTALLSNSSKQNFDD